ncbi:MAG: YwiC-like family protein [Anaerolineae bacterium]|nr:YwiC-like family protein [Anaerolineae bacterium]
MIVNAQRLKTVALPSEHGAWGFLLEPLLLGLLVAPSWAGVGIAVGVIGAFLMRQPLKIAWVDRQRGRRYARTTLAERVALGFGVIAALGLGAALLGAGPLILLPFLFGLPLAGIIFGSYVQNRGRDLFSELAGAAVLALAAISLALAGDTSTEIAVVLWIILLARSIPSILYIRARLRLEKKRPYNPAVPLVAHVIGLAVVGVCVTLDYAPLLALAAIVILLARAAYGLSPYRGRVRVSTIGFLELFYGLLTVLLVAIGYAL